MQPVAHKALDTILAKAYCPLFVAASQNVGLLNIFAEPGEPMSSLHLKSS